MILIVKSPFALLTSLATLTALSACGQTGPLYMPKPPTRTPAANTNAEIEQLVDVPGRLANSFDLQPARAKVRAA